MKRLKIALAILLVILLSGCSALSFEGTDIMSPPKATGNKAHIQKLIDKQTTGDYTLKYPKNGSNRSSIVTQDIDSDEDEEAIAFYSDKNGEHIHALFVESENGDYRVLSDIILEASSIDRVDFADIDGDKVSEVLIGYSVSTSSLNTLNVYTYSDEIIPLDVSYTYSSLVSGDFNSDKKDDILLISLYSGDVSAQAKLMTGNLSGSLSEVGTADLDSDVKSLALTQYGQISYGTYGAVIDGISSAGDYTTQVVFFNPSTPALLNPLYTYSGYSSTRRTTQVCSTDFDKDELIDIPVCSLMAHAEGEDVNTLSRQISWSNFDTESYLLKTAERAIICPKDGYVFTMPDKWKDLVTARYNEKERTTTVYMYEYSQNTVKLLDKIVTIKAYLDEDFDKDSSGYTEFLRSGSTVYAYSIGTADNFLSVSGDEISSHFSLVNQ
ncbi:MAG: hypothetical protein IJO20_05490 [Ruminococcus sp.]|nr:hypothetical protein [Ruminococcus sp.]MBQ7133932.1 hypothetical protein [Ruminococcus sp.]